MKHKEFAPDYTHVVNAAKNRQAARMPLYEHGVGEKVIFETTGLRPYQRMFDTDMNESRQAFSDFWTFWRTMGYDTASMEFQITGILEGAGALGAHQEGSIKNRADFERYPWADIPRRFFDRYLPYIHAFAETCPPGMAAVGGVGNGIFECVQDIVGYMDLCYIQADDPELFDDLFAAMGNAQDAIWTRFMAECADVFCVLRFGDDLGFNTATLIAPDDIRRCVVPQYHRVIDTVHRHGKPFLLHSCGNIFAVMDDLIDGAGIDAKHSNEDGIAHFSVWAERYGDRIGNFGGIDTDVLCRQSPQAIDAYVADCLERVRGKGGIAFGSGNSIPDYVPTEGYMAMVGAVRSRRGE